MTKTVFECGNDKCAYAMDAEGLNRVKLEALRRWPKTCPRCGQLTRWLEKLSLLNTQTTNSKTYGGSRNEKRPTKTRTPDH